MPKDTSNKLKKSSERGVKSKAKKDPKAPKRALSAYMFFSQDWRERIKNENPDAGFGELGKLLGAKWKELSAAERKPYAEQAVQDKARAKQQKAEYEAKATTTSGGEDAEEADDDEE